MANADAAADFKQGVDFLQSGNPDAAITYLRNAVAADLRNPYYLSFLGLAVGRAQKRWPAAWELCEAAHRMNPNEPQFYLNLAEVYASGNRRKDAHDLLELAVKRFGPDADIARETHRLRKRNGQVLPFVARPLNPSLEMSSPSNPEEAKP
jgi:predicted Zn-dependent protease